MNYHFSLSLLLAPALFSLPLAAETSAPVTPAAAEAPAPLAERLRAVLDGMEKAQSDDFYEAAKLVVRETGDPTAFYGLMEEASRSGSAAATVWLVQIYGQCLNGHGGVSAPVVPDASDPRAAELRSRMLAAADKGYYPAYLEAASMLMQGFGGSQDEERGKRYLMQGSKAGSPQARAGYLLCTGRLAKNDAAEPAVAAELKRKNYHLALLMTRNELETAEFVSWMRLASEYGSPAAPYLLTQSRAAALPEAESLKMLRLAVERHHPAALALYGSLKLQADKLGGALAAEADVEGGLQLLAIAAALGDPDAAQSLATALAQGIMLPVNAARVCSLFRMAAEQGNPHGLAGYGYCLLTGRGCTADAATGGALLRQGIDKGALWGNQALASVLYNGDGVKPDLRSAVNALGEDAAMGSVHAYAIMAGITALGNAATAPDSTRARIYLNMAKDEDLEAQAVYDAILAAKGWRFFPLLWE